MLKLAVFFTGIAMSSFVFAADQVDSVETKVSESLRQFTNLKQEIGVKTLRDEYTKLFNKSQAAIWRAEGLKSIVELRGLQPNSFRGATPQQNVDYLIAKGRVSADKLKLSNEALVAEFKVAEAERLEADQRFNRYRLALDLLDEYNWQKTEKLDGSIIPKN